MEITLGKFWISVGWFPNEELVFFSISILATSPLWGIELIGIQALRFVLAFGFEFEE